MPELAEVETFRRILHDALVGQRLDHVDAVEDTLVFDDVHPDVIQQALSGRTVVDTGRHGKHAWMSLDNGAHLLLHFGMSGSVVVEDDENISHVKLRLQSAANTVVYRCPRRIGRLRLRHDLYGEPPLSKLGPDPYTALPDADDFASLFRRRQKTIKGMLLDQSILAGVGNWLADEVLYQSRIAPHRKAASLDDNDIQLLRQRLQEVLALAVDVRADETHFPKHWLFHVRWGKQEDAATHDGLPLQFDTVAGRTTAWVPDLQS